jgi:hypothetical protein
MTPVKEGETKEFLDILFDPKHRQFESHPPRDVRTPVNNLNIRTGPM